MSPDQIIAAVIALVVGNSEPSFCTIRDGGADTRYPGKVEACPRPLPAGEVEGQTVCGFRRGWACMQRQAADWFFEPQAAMARASCQIC